MKCSRPNCPGVVGHRGFCQAHYDAWRHENPPIPATIVVEHLRNLRNSGLTWRDISTLSGISRNTIYHICKPGKKYACADTARQLLGVVVPDIPHYTAAPDLKRIPMLGTTRRLQALSAMGYTSGQMAAWIGYDYKHFGQLLNGTKPSVTVAVAKRVDALFQRLQLEPAPDTWAGRRARTRAVNLGWPAPLAWDEDTIDNPAAQPFTGRSTRLSWLERYTELRDLGYNDVQICDKLGCTPEALERQQFRFGMHKTRQAAS
jgi:hypothetical protein